MLTVLRSRLCSNLWYNGFSGCSPRREIGFGLTLGPALHTHELEHSWTSFKFFSALQGYLWVGFLCPVETWSLVFSFRLLYQRLHQTFSFYYSHLYVVGFNRDVFVCITIHFDFIFIICHHFLNFAIIITITSVFFQASFGTSCLCCMVWKIKIEHMSFLSENL